MKKSLSILIPAHNEESRIGKALDNLSKIKNAEIIVGLDGCEDRTEEIVKKYNFVKVIKNKKRQGKPKTLLKLLKKARGDVIIIHDADLIFFCKNINQLIKVFDNKGIGAVDIPNIFMDNEINFDSVLHLGDAWNTKFIVEYKVKKFTKKVNGLIYVDESKATYFPFFVNIFRRGLIDDAKTLADDGERGIQILNKGYKILVVMNSKNFPHFHVNYNDVNFKRMFHQKLRGRIAQKQVKRLYGMYSINFLNFHLPFMLYVFKNLNRIKKQRFKSISGIFLVWAIMFAAMIKANFLKNITTKKGWGLR